MVTAQHVFGFDSKRKQEKKNWLKKNSDFFNNYIYTQTPRSQVNITNVFEFDINYPDFLTIKFPLQVIVETDQSLIGTNWKYLKDAINQIS